MRRFIYYPIKYTINSLAVKVKSAAQGPILNKLRIIPDYPNSAVKFKDAINITSSSASQTFDELNFFFKSSPLIISETQDGTAFGSVQLNNLPFKLRELLDYHGSDKGSYNGYHHIYGEVLSKLDFSKPTVIAEIGLGSRNPRIPSNMGKSGKPGASLRAWRDISEKTTVYGLDVDRDALFTEPRIETFFHDQTSEEDWRLLRKIIKPQTVDVFIDDGLHTPSANLCFLNNAVEFVRPGGWLIIEDIPARALPIWRLVMAIPKSEINFKMFKGIHSYVLVGNKKK
jgi:hypothetical protein